MNWALNSPADGLKGVLLITLWPIELMHITGKRSFSQIRDQLKQEAKALNSLENDVGDETGDNEDGDDPRRNKSPFIVIILISCYNISTLNIINEQHSSSGRVKGIIKECV